MQHRRGALRRRGRRYRCGRCPWPDPYAICAHDSDGALSGIGARRSDCPALIKPPRLKRPRLKAEAMSTREEDQPRITDRRASMAPDEEQDLEQEPQAGQSDKPLSVQLEEEREKAQSYLAS